MTAVSVGLLDSIEAMEGAPDAPIPFVPVACLVPLDEPELDASSADLLNAAASPLPYTLGDLVEGADMRILDIRKTAEPYARAVALEQQLEDERPAIKEAAIIRLMQARKIASTPAEKIVELDEAYMAHRVKQREATIDRMRWHAAYDAATRAADLAVALVQTTNRRER